MQNEIFDNQNKSNCLLSNNNLELNINHNLANNENNYDAKYKMTYKERNVCFLNNNLQIDKENKRIIFNLYFFLRLFLVVTLLTIISLNTVYGFASPHGNVKCIVDRLFIATENLNKFFNKSTSGRYILIILSSFCIDFAILYMAIVWSFWGKSWRIIISLVLFYMFRDFNQVIFY